MAIIKAPTWYADLAQGTFGDANQHHLYVDLAAAAVNDVVELGKLHPGCRIDDIKAVSEALGAGTGFKLGYKSESATDDDYFMTVADSASAATTRSAVAPIVFDENTTLTLTVTGATATGRVDIVAFGVYEGK